MAVSSSANSVADMPWPAGPMTSCAVIVAVIGAVVARSGHVTTLAVTEAGAGADGALAQPDADPAVRVMLAEVDMRLRCVEREALVCQLEA